MVFDTWEEKLRSWRMFVRRNLKGWETEQILLSSEFFRGERPISKIGRQEMLEI